MNTTIMNGSDNQLNQDILSLLSESISRREKNEVHLADIMEYEDHRTPMEELYEDDFIIDGVRGNVFLTQGQILLTREIEKIDKESQTFFNTKP